MGISVKNHDLNFVPDTIDDPRSITRDFSVNRNPDTNDFHTNQKQVNLTNYDNETIGLVNDTYGIHPKHTGKFYPNKFFTMEISSAEGAMSLGGAFERCTFMIGDGLLDSHIKFTANIDTINTAIEKLRFLPRKEFNTWEQGFATIEMTVSNNVSATSTHHVRLAVEPRNDLPILRLPGEEYAPIVETDPYNV